jgi:streptogramin lyase
MNSNLCASGGRLWFVGGYSIEDEQDPIRQKLYALNPTTSTKTTYDLLCRPGLARAWLADGFNGFVYVTCPNDVAVMKVDNLTGSMTQIRVNSTPTRIESGQDRRIWVNSFAGMLSLIDYDDDQVHNQYGTDGDGALSFQTEYGDTTKMWYLSGSGLLVRYDLNTLQLFEKGTGNDFNFTHPELGNPDALLITQPVTYQDPAGNTVNVLPYVILIQDGKLLAFRLYRYLYREAFSELNGQGAVSSGVELYFGE